MKHLATALFASLLLGCSPHSDSVYLGRKEAKVLEAVNNGDLAAVEAFLDKGGNVNLQDEPGMTPLHHAVNGDWAGANLPMVKLLIDRGANVRAIDDTHHTPLHLASSQETAELLINAGADVNARTLADRETILFSAAWGAALGGGKSYQRYLDLTRLLIAKGADVNLTRKSGETVLHQVVQSHSEKHACEVTELLIAAGGDVNALDGMGQTPLDVALANGREETAAFLRQHGGRAGDERRRSPEETTNAY